MPSKSSATAVWWSARRPKERSRARLTFVATAMSAPLRFTDRDTKRVVRTAGFGSALTHGVGKPPGYTGYLCSGEAIPVCVKDGPALRAPEAELLSPVRAAPRSMARGVRDAVSPRVPPRVRAGTVASSTRGRPPRGVAVAS